MTSDKLFQYLVKLSLFFTLLGQGVAFALPLTLVQAEKAALSQSPELRSLQAKSHALGESAIAAGQLSDPKLTFGTLNVPVDSFNFSQEAMTQIQVGLQQTFPRGHSLHYRSLQQKKVAVAEYYRFQTMRVEVLRGVRVSWLNLFYWFHAKRIIEDQKSVFRHLVTVTESMLANNKAQQKDVIRAQLELTELDNRLLYVHEQMDTARAQLARWIGPTLANRANPRQLPRWRSPPKIQRMQAIIKQHPELKTDQSLIAAGHAGIHLAQQQYRPGFAVGAAYGFRQGRDTDGRKRSDFLTAQVSMDLPFFTANRQDRTLKASEDTLVANEENEMSHYRQLRENLKIQYAAWREQSKSSWLYRAHLIPQARQYAEATMTAYQNVQTDFPTLARAYVRELDTELGGLKAKVTRDIARVNLLYLEGQ